MNTPAHSPKLDMPSERDLRLAVLLAKWRERVASEFVAMDPLPPRARLMADLRLASAFASAAIALICIRSRRRELQRIASRGGLRVLNGGRT